MSKALTPKQVARALDVSESSLKRWCDRGLIEASTTSGGHRRLALDSVLRFVRSTGKPLVHPELLGLPARTGHGPRTMRRAAEDIQQAFLDGDEVRARQVLQDLHAAGVPFSKTGDEVLAPAFRAIGEAWACGQAEVYHERRAVETCSRALHDLRQMLPPPPAGAPLAIGGAPDTDPYSLAGAMVELVLRQRGWDAHHLGSRLPLATLVRAVDQLQPKLLWLSVSHLDDKRQFVADYGEFWRQVKGRVAVVLGGQALHLELRRQICSSAFCDTLEHLEEFLRVAQFTSDRGKPSPGEGQTAEPRRRKRGR
jgi:methanogenic corrinoid protein MtbC1